MEKERDLFRIFYFIKSMSILLVISLAICISGGCGMSRESKDSMTSEAEVPQPLEEILTPEPEVSQPLKALPAPGPGTSAYCSEISISGAWLYYAGSNINSGLYAYNLETKEKVQITEDAGKIVETANGIFYNVNGKIYEIGELSLEFLIQLPIGVELVDYDQDKAYWIVGGRTLYMGKLDEEKIVKEEDTTILFPVSQKTRSIIRVKIYKEKAYVERFDGLYLVDMETGETSCILDEELSYVASSLAGEYLFVGQKSGDEGIYMVSLEDGTLQKIDGPHFNFVLLHDKTIYYNGKGIMSYDLENGDIKRLSKEGYQDRTGSYGGVVFYDHYLVLRCEFYYEIYRFDVQTGEIECIISRDETKK